MDLLVIIMLILYVMSFSLYMFLYYKVDKKKVVIFKLIASFMFIVLGFFCIIRNISFNNEYSKYIFLGLICGFIGDALLGIRGLYPEKKMKYFILGLLMFFIGHLLYLKVLYDFYDGEGIYILFLSVLLTGLVVIILEVVKVNFGKLRVINYLYMFICATLLSITIINLFQGYSFLRLIQFIGFFSFTSSDLMLCFIYFKKVDVRRFKLLKYLNIITYYIGQGLIALSLFYLL